MIMRLGKFSSVIKSLSVPVTPLLPSVLWNVRQCHKALLSRNSCSDNGIFSSEGFEHEVEEHLQRITFSGVGAQHQNAAAERAIGVAQNVARAMLPHPRVCWPDEFDPSPWPFALSYAVWIHDRLPHSSRANVSAEDIFSNTYGGSTDRKSVV